MGYNILLVTRYSLLVTRYSLLATRHSYLTITQERKTYKSVTVSLCALMHNRDEVTSSLL